MKYITYLIASLAAAVAFSSCAALDGTTWTIKDGTVTVTPPPGPIVIDVTDSAK